MATKWRGRWIEATPRLSAAESEGLAEKDLLALIEATLSDDPRSGTPDTFTPEQLVQVVVVACWKVWYNPFGNRLLSCSSTNLSSKT